MQGPQPHPGSTEPISGSGPQESAFEPADPRPRLAAGLPRRGGGPQAEPSRPHGPGPAAEKVRQQRKGQRSAPTHGSPPRVEAVRGAPGSTEEPLAEHAFHAHHTRAHDKGIRVSQGGWRHGWGAWKSRSLGGGLGPSLNTLHAPWVKGGVSRAPRSPAPGLAPPLSSRKKECWLNKRP